MRIVLDIGLPLGVVDPETVELHPIKGFDAPHPSLLGVIISHPHQDHYGLARRLPQETPFLIGKGAEAILSAAVIFSPAGLKFKNVTHLEHRRMIALGPFKVTPYLVDHSAYDSYAILVEADGERVFYTGDFRMHGRKARLMEELLNDPPKDVDVLLMEGTCIGRETAEQRFLTEDELVPKFAGIFEQTEGMPLVWCSGQNIDRIVTIVKACYKANRRFIIDMYTAEILDSTGNDRLPQGTWDSISVFLPASQRQRIIENSAFIIADRFRRHRTYPEELREAAPRSVMLFRPSMRNELERAKCLTGASMVHSLWAGYLELPENREFVEWLQSRRISVHHCHTSGHACLGDLKRMKDAFPRAVIVPFHSDAQQRFMKTFSRVVCRSDREWWSVAHKQQASIKSNKMNFSTWSQRWNKLRTFDKNSNMVSEVLDLWKTPAPKECLRSEWPMPRGYRKRNENDRGEQKIERQLFTEGTFDVTKLTNGKPETFNLVPIFHNVACATQQKGQTITDALGVLTVGKKKHPVAIEVKVDANDLWYAIVENLKQVKMMRANLGNLGRLIAPPETNEDTEYKGTWGIVLAPEAYYTKHKKSAATGSVLELLTTMLTSTEARIILVSDSGIETRKLAFKGGYWPGDRKKTIYNPFT